MIIEQKNMLKMCISYLKKMVIFQSTILVCQQLVVNADGLSESSNEKGFISGVDWSRRGKHVTAFDPGKKKWSCHGNAVVVTQ